MGKIFSRGLLAGLLLLAVGTVLTPLFNLLAPSLKTEYENQAIFRPWSDPLMMLYFLYPLLLGVIFSWVWAKTKSLFAGTSSFRRGLTFASVYAAVSLLPGMFITYSSFQVSLPMVLSWTGSGFLGAIAAGWLIARLDP
ncbi:MAG: hypothetical protein UY92_C0004G0069 [Candidatus Magasanikbacteria bacterium GW2011_GWA2_56_11]|uniref:Uncharacterized protein n=1 Tax=Candidatus Magasanikbacteria bacterium GW2011_GWA2_56_11 TaxID=1619044 RepID=A0A0G1YH32_9BACT|nr:MAG: hypothetical protein UY92_C0004G0069 [Candidatus Magasanikbacteria bacterium GW2011_GWA2_56_11]